jgi:1,4-dihydroxy-2-naphthoate polyprenyltransferase
MRINCGFAHLSHARVMTHPSLSTWIAATRPGFLSVTLCTAVLGVVIAQACGCGWDPWAAVATVVLAVLTHAAVNLYNDYGDAMIGSDAVNTERIAPFTGGSRFIQDGRLSAAQVREAAQMLAIVVVGGGVALAARAGPGLLGVGLAGLAIGAAYSHPRVALMSRGWGEAGVVLGWWLVVVGADYVQRHGFSGIAATAALSPALLVGTVLLVAEFPDAKADAQVGKRTLVVRLGGRGGAWLYAATVLWAHAWVAVWWWRDVLPGTAWWSLASLAPGLAASGLLLVRWPHVATLRPVIVLTLVTALLHTALLAAAFVAIARLR